VGYGGTQEKAKDHRGSGAVLAPTDRDLVQGLTVSDIGRKIGSAQTISYRRRPRHAPEQVDPGAPGLASGSSRWNTSSGSSPNCSRTNRCSRTAR
jgi:hypothetical protein